MLAIGEYGIERVTNKSDAEVERDLAHAAWMSGVFRSESKKSGIVPPWIAPRFVGCYRDGYAGRVFSYNSSNVDTQPHRGSGRKPGHSKTSSRFSR